MEELRKTAQRLMADFENENKLLLENIQSFEIEQARIKWLGRKGLVTELFSKLGSVSKEDRPKAGQIVNEIKEKIENELQTLKDRSILLALSKAAKERCDITLPVNSLERKGSLHPVTLMYERLVEIFHRFGFSVFDGPEIDFDFYNFSALNIPENHPARDMQDTFFLKDCKNTVLRTQTSNIQIHAMLANKPPLKIIAPGRVFRVDSDATHTPMFHQIECVVVDEHINFAHLKGLIAAFLAEVFQTEMKTRFRPSYFPFVEPGAEVDMACTICSGTGCRVCSHTGWIEIGGCGMIHPNVFEAVQIDSDTYSGFAFGFGIDRMAMLAYKLPDLRQFFEADQAFHKQFPQYTL